MNQTKLITTSFPHERESRGFYEPDEINNYVIPAQAGIQKSKRIFSGFRIKSGMMDQVRNDGSSLE